MRNVDYKRQDDEKFLVVVTLEAPLDVFEEHSAICLARANHHQT